MAPRNHRLLDLDNGMLGTILDVTDESGAMLIQTDLGELRAVDAGYVANHLEHAYALTAHSAQGATFEWTGVIGRPEEFTHEWAYTALSRARRQTALHVVMGLPAREREREENAPPARDRDLAEGQQALANAMRRTEIEQLATERTGPGVSGTGSQPPASEPPLASASPGACSTRPSQLNRIDALRRSTPHRHGPRLTRG